MEIDHFDPRKKLDRYQNYENLFLASRHCNGAKRDIWPTDDELMLRIRFLNCCEEWDYGDHILEYPNTGFLYGVTRAGRFHIRVCHLNAEHLVKWRLERTKKRQEVHKLRSLLRRLMSILMSRSPSPEGRLIEQSRIAVEKELAARNRELTALIPRIPQVGGRSRQACES
jgi:hypothetical protein